MATSLIPLRQKKRLVTYHVDTNTTYTAKYKKNANVLADLSFTPSKSGWTFVGWRQDTTASSSVLSYLRMGSEEITLYAVYKQTITLSYAGNGATSGSTSQQTGTRYYNAAGVYANPSFTLRSNSFTRTGYSFSKWAQNSASGTQYSAGASVTLSADATFYAVWTAQVCKVSLYLHPDGGFQDGYVSVKITLNSSGTSVYSTSLSQDDIYESTGDVYGSVTCAGIVAVSYFETDDYPAYYYTCQARVTAKTTLYSNTGLSTVGLSSGSSIFYNQHDQVGTRSATYYVSYDKLSL